MVTATGITGYAIVLAAAGHIMSGHCTGILPGVVMHGTVMVCGCHSVIRDNGGGCAAHTHTIDYQHLSDKTQQTHECQRFGQFSKITHHHLWFCYPV